MSKLKSDIILLADSLDFAHGSDTHPMGRCVREICAQFRAVAKGRPFDREKVAAHLAAMRAAVQAQGALGFDAINSSALPTTGGA